ncbi:transglycosylase SLT domain-containing protein [Aquabacterium sp. J223]|uniref:transglycosylase SLT domain-containing protein n=1 Tax=Aquabacterium sp. J223 TaxID=2898431 RepID=UPI0021AD70DD|nr:transglycosylase SLT domain-containing protein [Aquabacterium sp. J223]UUX97738.1 transglycosylase SLT domain-containing protein [Aquabacterium sp. J223]
MTAAARLPSLRRGAALLAAGAAVLWLGGCATPGLTTPADGSAQAGARTAAAATETAAPQPAPPLVPLPATPPAPPPAGALDPLQADLPVDLQAEAAKADLWDRVRKGFAMPDLDSDLVRNREQWYVTKPDYVRRMTERGSRYLFHIVEELERRQMPTELALLPFIESAFNPQALSSAKASGMWQFMPATGRDYELKQNLFRDDRRDVLESTRAALDYLQRLHGLFGDWHLALAAYNWGEGSVQRAIDRNQRQGLPTDYQSLRMPEETRWYVPKLQAVKNIVARPDTFGVTLAPLANHPYFVTVPIERDIDVALAARLAGLTAEEFKQLNPQMNKPLILAAGSARLLLPFDNAETFQRNLARHRGPLASWTAWVATRTLKPADAARELGVAETELREVNRIPPRMLVKAGSTLLVPRKAAVAEDVASHIADNAAIALAPDVPPFRRVTVKVGRKGESVAALARRHRLDAALVAQWNGVGERSTFKPGQSVVLQLPLSSRTAARPAARTTAATGGRRAVTVQAAKPVRSTVARGGAGRGDKARPATPVRVARGKPPLS